MPEMTMKLKPWLVPNFVTSEMPPGQRQDGFREAPTWPLSEIPADVLAEMCDDFRAEVFRKAGKTDPKGYNR